MLNLKQRSYTFLGALLAFSILGLSFYLEFSRHLAPCSLCYIQRVIISIIGAIFFLEWLHGPRSFGRILYTLLLSIFSCLGIAAATYHLWLQHRPEGSVENCGATLQYLIKNYPLLDALKMFTHAPGDCGKVDILILGMSIPAWALIAFVILWAIALKSFTKTR